MQAEELDVLCAVIANPLEYNIPKYFLNSQVSLPPSLHGLCRRGPSIRRRLRRGRREIRVL